MSILCLCITAYGTFVSIISFWHNIQTEKVDLKLRYKIGLLLPFRSSPCYQSSQHYNKNILDELKT